MVSVYILILSILPGKNLRHPQTWIHINKMLLMPEVFGEVPVLFYSPVGESL
jgi:hypothetical protein